MAQDILILIGGGALLAITILATLIVMDRRRRAHLDRLKRTFPARLGADVMRPSTKRRGTTGAGAEDPVGRALARVDQALMRAGFQLSAGERLTQLSTAIPGIYAGLVLGLRLNPHLAVPLAVAGPSLGKMTILRTARGRRLAAFTAGLPEALDVIARGLKAGRPVSDSLSIAVENAPEPLRTEFAICHGQLCLGTGLADSFADRTQRMPTAEASFFGVASALQTETGDNLVETTENLAAQLRDLRKLKQKARECRRLDGLCRTGRRCASQGSFPRADDVRYRSWMPPRKGAFHLPPVRIW